MQNRMLEVYTAVKLTAGSHRESRKGACLKNGIHVLTCSLRLVAEITSWHQRRLGLEVLGSEWWTLWLDGEDAQLISSRFHKFLLQLVAN